ncbi:MAG: anti-sigma factor antagonist, partial [Clostridia bacterium]|nr:anti-sigma factor antagonist [Clostridia bacterium]
MDYKLNGNTLTIYLNGRVDSNNASAVESEIASIREANSHTALVLDAEKLEYLSSAGLRIVLRLKKAVNDMKIVGVSPDVYEIFDMTGFTEMMTVEKAYRVISVDGCEVIGQGANGKVYRISGDTIVKVYLSPDSLDDIKRERDLAKKAFVLGVPTAISYDVARIAGGGYGSVFELLNATSLAKKLAAEPDKFDAIIGLYVDLLKKIHSTVVKKGDMPDMRSTAIKWAQFDKSYLPEGLGDKLISMVEAIPDCDNMIHGDYHVKNVMYQDGEALLIDMDTLSVGNPVFEFGSIYNAYAGFSEIDHTIV